jgi:hypothetical protein
MQYWSEVDSNIKREQFEADRTHSYVLRQAFLLVPIRLESGPRVGRGLMRSKSPKMMMLKGNFSTGSHNRNHW